MRSLAALLIMALAAAAADSGKQLLDAAHSGDVARIRALLQAGASIETRDRNGKTPLMQASEAGRADAVRLLLARGADAAARDKQGLTAYALAFLSHPGDADRAAVLEALPAPPRMRVAITASWLPQDVASSCFLGRADLLRAIGALNPDARALGALADYARVNGAAVLEIVRAATAGLSPEPGALPAAPEGVDAVVTLSVRPAVSCSRQSDMVSLAIDVRVVRPGKGSAYEKTFGGGLRGLRAQSVSNPEQYAPLFEKWADSHASSIFWGVLRSLMRQ